MEPRNRPTGRSLPDRTRIAIVGAGFSGLSVGARLRRAGCDDFVILERSCQVGGTWRDNSYPGSACDVPSHLYSFSFAPNPEWTWTFSRQAEIQSYLCRTAARERLVEKTVFECRLEGARWRPGTARWELLTSRGRVEAEFLVLATGPLSEPALPDLPGLDRFEGTLFHSAAWRHDHSLAGERIAVIGTGASAVQFVPEIRREAREVLVFQRTAPWVLPRFDRRLSRLERAAYRRFPSLQRLVRGGIYWAREAYAVPLLHRRLAPLARLAGLAFLRLQVKDAEVRRRATPGYDPGCKRILLSNDYLPALNSPNVQLVSEPIREVTRRGVVTEGGHQYDVDTIICGTGFHVSVGPVAEKVEGATGETLAEEWQGGLRALRGTTVSGFPNLFLLLGPNTGLGHTSVVLMAEAQADYIVGAIDACERRGDVALEPRREAEDRWNDEVQRRMRRTVWTGGSCVSWYLDRNGRNTTLWPDFSFRFRKALRRFDPNEYRFTPTRAGHPEAGTRTRAGAAAGV